MWYLKRHFFGDFACQVSSRTKFCCETGLKTSQKWGSYRNADKAIIIVARVLLFYTIFLLLVDINLIFEVLIAEIKIGFLKCVQEQFMHEQKYILSEMCRILI